MSVFSNDPRDVIQSVIKEGLKKTQEQGQAQGNPNTVTQDDLPVANPMESPNFTPTSFVIGGVVAFWYNFLRNFWYWIPLFMGILYFTVVSDPEALQKYLDAGVSMSTMTKGILINGLFASILGLFPTYFVGSRLKRGIPVQKKHIMWSTLPGILFGCFTLYDIAWVLILAFFV